MNSASDSFVEKTSQLDTATGVLNPSYVTGLSEGEATFTYIRNGNSINLRFALKLTEADKNLVFALQGFFGTGQVYRVGPKAEGWMYCATSLASLAIIVRHFDAFPLLGKKADDYKLWRQMWELKRVPRKIDLPALQSLAERLSSQRRKGRRYLKQNRWSNP